MSRRHFTPIGDRRESPFARIRFVSAEAAADEVRASVDAAIASVNQETAELNAAAATASGSQRSAEGPSGAGGQHEAAGVRGEAGQRDGSGASSSGQSEPVGARRPGGARGRTFTRNGISFVRREFTGLPWDVPVGFERYVSRWGDGRAYDEDDSFWLHPETDTVFVLHPARLVTDISDGILTFREVVGWQRWADDLTADEDSELATSLADLARAASRPS